jgi:5-methylcytosine-specific restriction endonuclease McrA
VTTPAPRKRRSRSRGGAAKKSAAKVGDRPPQHTSQSTTRAAYAETRRWLLAEHGPVCAYCARKFPAREMTLDHVSPRRGQDAYDRRDNLVLACKTCNAAKADKPILAFLLQRKERAVSLAQYGVHLSPMLRDMALQIADGIVSRDSASPSDEDSPYRDVGYREPLRPYRMVAHDDAPAVADAPRLVDGVVGAGDLAEDDKPRRPRRRGRSRRR